MIEIAHFTDPACPWAFSAEPARLRLRWHRGFTPELLAEGAASIQRRFGMPIDPSPRPRIPVSVHACRAVVAARLRAPDAEEPLLRALAGGLLDDPALLAAAARDAGLDPDRLQAWVGEPEVEEAPRPRSGATRRRATSSPASA